MPGQMQRLLAIGCAFVVAMALTVAADPCVPSPCLNGGTCTLTTNSTGGAAAHCTCTALYNGTLCDAPVCVYGGHYVFGGTESVAITIGAQLLSGVSFTVAVWARARVGMRGAAQYVVSSGTSETIQQSSLLMGYDADGRFRFGFSSQEAITAVAYGVNDTGVWHHWTGVYLLPNTLMLYRDGNEVARYVGASFFGYGTLFVAYSPFYPARSFVGAVDELRVWTRALSVDEVRRGARLRVWSDTALVIYVPFSPLSVYDAASGFATVSTGTPSYSADNTPNGANCTLAPCVINPCTGRGNCTAVRDGSYPQCSCPTDYTGAACEIALVAGTAVADPDGDESNALSRDSIIGIAVAAAVLFCVLLIGAIMYCRLSQQNPIRPAGVSGASPGQPLPKGVTTAEQLHALQNEGQSSAPPIPVVGDGGAGAAVAGAAAPAPGAPGAPVVSGHRSSIEMHSIGIEPANRGSVASVDGAAGSGSGSSSGAGSSDSRRFSIEMLPIPAALAGPPLNRQPSGPALVRQPSADPQQPALPAGSTHMARQASDGSPVMLPAGSTQMYRQPSDQLPGDSTAFMRLASESQVRPPGMALLPPPVSPALSRNSSEQSTAIPVAGPPPLIRGDSLKAVLMGKRKDQVCASCQFSNDEGSAFCSRCGSFFKTNGGGGNSAPASPRSAAAAAAPATASAAAAPAS